MKRTFHDILLIRSGALGDFLFSLPAVEALRKAYSDARIELMGHQEFVALAQRCRCADSISSIDRAEVAALFSRDAPVSSALSRRLKQCDLVLAYLSDPDGVVQMRLRSLCSGMVVVFSPILPAEWALHVVDYLLLPILTLGIAAENRQPTLVLPDEDRVTGHQLLAERGVDIARPVVAIHPGAGNPKKRWPAGEFARLADSLARTCSVILVSGPADANATAEVLDMSQNSARIVVLNELPLLAVAQVLSRCRLFVGNDSGVTHLAAALGVPAVGLFGPTNPVHWAPRSPFVRILCSSTGEMAAVSLSAVLKTAEELLGSTSGG